MTCLDQRGHALGTDSEKYLVYEKDAETNRPPNIFNPFTFCPYCGVRVSEAKEAYDIKYVSKRFPL